MRQNNLKLLTGLELAQLKKAYYFDLNESKTKIIVGNTNYKRETYHPITEGFTLNSKIRVIRISKKAIEIWMELNQKYNLFDVQEVVTMLLLMVQEVDGGLVKKLLDKRILSKLD